ASKDIDTMPTALTARIAMAKKRDIRLLIECSCFELTPSGAPGQGKWNGRNGGPTKGEQAIAYVYLNSSVILTGTQYSSSTQRSEERRVGKEVRKTRSMSVD